MAKFKIFLLLAIVLVPLILLASGHPLIWKNFTKTGSAPYSWSSSLNHLTVVRTAAGQDSSILTEVFNLDRKDQRFGGLVTLTIKHDSIAVAAGSADTIWVTGADAVGAHRPDTVSYFLQQQYGEDWFTVEDTIEWRLAGTLGTTKKRFFLPTDFGVTYLWSTIPSDVSGTNPYRHSINNFRVGARFDDFQDSARFGIDNRAYGQ